MSLGVGEVFAGYTVVRLLGSGGMGEVYLATHPRLPRQDAIKVLPVEVSADADFRVRFEREADLVATLWHPHIVGVHDRGEDEGRLWIAMDFVDGSDAARLVHDEYPNGMPTDLVIEIVTAIADALDYAHERHLLHRDVKPANIMLTAGPRRRILLTDFGIARRNDDDALTATNLTMGSAPYSSPEQLMGETLDGRADQYSLAATAYQLLSGKPPFTHTNANVVISHHLTVPAPALDHARPDLAALAPAMAKALSKLPAQRFDTCRDFAAALRDGVDVTVHVASNSAETTVVDEPFVTDETTVQVPFDSTQKFDTGATQHVAGPTQHIAGPTQHIAGPTQHILGPTQHIDADATQHVAGPTQQFAGPTQQIAGPTQHIAGPTEQFAGPTQHIAPAESPTAYVATSHVPTAPAGGAPPTFVSAWATDKRYADPSSPPTELDEMPVVKTTAAAYSECPPEDDYPPYAPYLENPPYGNEPQYPSQPIYQPQPTADVQAAPQSGSKAKIWVLVGLAAALVVAAVLAITLSGGGNKDTAAPGTQSGEPSSSAAGTSSGRPSGTSRPIPPTVEDPDSTGESCPTGYALDERDEWGSASIRGSTETTCSFAAEVLSAYWVDGPPSPNSRTVLTSGVDVTCAVEGDDPWITCRGGSMVVFLF